MGPEASMMEKYGHVILVTWRIALQDIFCSICMLGDAASVMHVFQEMLIFLWLTLR